MDITIADRRLDFEIHRTLNKVLSEPRTSLTVRFCRELKTSLQIKQEQQELEAIKTRIQASRRRISKVNKKPWRRAKAVRSVWHRDFGTHLSPSGPDEIKADDYMAPTCLSMSRSSTISSSPEASLQAQAAVTQAIEIESSGTEPGDHGNQVLHSTSTEEEQHIIWERAEDQRRQADSALATDRPMIGNVALQAQKEIAAAPNNRQVVPATNRQAQEADSTEQRKLSDERETRTAATERILGAREARLRIREENVLGREAALLERETTLMERERAFVLRNRTGV